MDFNKWIKELWQLNGETKLKDIRFILNSLKFKKTFKIINVVGTNGKGSVTKYLSDNLIKAGYKVGTFTSPHIVSFNERIKVNNYKITDKQFYDMVNPLLDIFKKFNIMWFSILYIAAMMYFSEKEVDYVILEAGIGGSKDATNAVDGDFGVITSISEDHLDIFKSRDNIAADKAGIINETMIFFLPSLDKSDAKAFYDRKKEVGFTLIKVDTTKCENYMESNKLLASDMLEFILDSEDFVFKNPRGRMETISKNIILDVAHNQNGIESVWSLLKQNNAGIEQVVLSLSKDKDVNFDFDGLPVYLYVNKGRKPMSIENYKVNGKEIKNLKLFVNKIDKKTLFIGSFYLASELMEIINDVK